LSLLEEYWGTIGSLFKFYNGSALMYMINKFPKLKELALQSVKEMPTIPFGPSWTSAAIYVELQQKGFSEEYDYDDYGNNVLGVM
jgi:hypothetical protein